MKELFKAMVEEELYINDRLNGMQTSLIERITPFGYNNLDEYFKDKKLYLFEQWNPKVYYIDVKTLTLDLEKAIQSEQYGIYISTADYLYAFHGSDDIDYELCKKLNVQVAELYHTGGTIIGGPRDLGIEIIAPNKIQLNKEFILNEIYKILNKYLDNIEIQGNDILLDEKKILGSMERQINGVYVWAAQFSFEDHEELIKQICRKKRIKTPGFINEEILSKKKLEEEILKWLTKQKF